MTLAVLLLLAVGQGAPSPQVLAREAHIEFEAGKYLQAREKLRKALSRDPQNPALWSYLGLTEAKLNNVDSAISAFQITLKLAPDDAQSFFNMGLLYAQKGDAGKAIEAYQRGLKLEPANPSANKNYALLLMRDGRSREAVPPLERLRHLEGEGLATRVTLIDCYLKAGMEANADREIQAYLGLPNVSVADDLKLAGVLIEDKQPDKAQKVLEHVVQAAPDLADAQAQLGTLLVKKGQYKSGVFALGRAVQLAPESAEYSMKLAEALIRWKHNRTAMEFLNSVKSRFGTLPDYRYLMAVTHYGLHQYPEAIADLEGVLLERPNLGRAEFLLANCYIGELELDKAETHYRKAITLEPANSAYYTALAEVLRKTRADNTDEAIETLDKALSLNHADVQAKVELALCYEARKEFVKAQGLLEQAIEQRPDVIAAHVALSRVYYRQGKNTQADREKMIVSRLESDEQARQSRLREARAHSPQ